MTKINKILDPSLNLSPTEISQVSNKKIIKDSFKTKLKNLDQEEIKIKLEGLFSEIEELSSKLQESLFIEDLVSYKKLVRDFLDMAVNNSHIFLKENTLDRRGRHRVFSIVKRVNLELDELTQDFLDIEGKRIEILKRIDKITGILMDILA